MGHGLQLASHYATFEEVKESIERYRAAFKKAGHRHKPRVAVLSEVFVDTTKKKAQEVAAECYVWNAKYTGKILKSLGSKPIKSYEGYYEMAQAGGIPDEKMTFDALQEVNSIVVGDPDYCIERLKAFEGPGSRPAYLLDASGRDASREGDGLDEAILGEGHTGPSRLAD